MIVVYHVKLNVSQSNVIKGLLAKQRDSNSRFMDCAFYHEKRRLTVPTECTAVVNAMRADGEYRSFAGSVNTDNTVRIPLTNWMLDQEGTLRCSITVYEGDEKLTTASFEIPVERSENPTGTVSPDDPKVDLAEQLLEQCEACAERAEAAVELIPEVTVAVERGVDTTSFLVFDGNVLDGFTVHVVDELPDVGENTNDFTIVYFLNNEADFAVCKEHPYDYLYSYVTEAMSAQAGVAAGWYKTSVFIEQLYGFVPTAILLTKGEMKLLDDVDAECFYIVVDEQLVHEYKEDESTTKSVLTKMNKIIQVGVESNITTGSDMIKIWDLCGCDVKADVQLNGKRMLMNLGGFINDHAVFNFISQDMAYEISVYPRNELGFASVSRHASQLVAVPAQEHHMRDSRLLRAYYDESAQVNTYEWIAYYDNISQHTLRLDDSPDPDIPNAYHLSTQNYPSLEDELNDIEAQIIRGEKVEITLVVHTDEHTLTRVGSFTPDYYSFSGSMRLSGHSLDVLHADNVLYDCSFVAEKNNRTQTWTRCYVTVYKYTGLTPVIQ